MQTKSATAINLQTRTSNNIHVCSLDLVYIGVAEVSDKLYNVQVLASLQYSCVN